MDEEAIFFFLSGGVIAFGAAPALLLAWRADTILRVTWAADLGGGDRLNWYAM